MLLHKRASGLVQLPHVWLSGHGQSLQVPPTEYKVLFL